MSASQHEQQGNTPYYLILLKYFQRVQREGLTKAQARTQARTYGMFHARDEDVLRDTEHALNEVYGGEQ